MTIKLEPFAVLLLVDRGGLGGVRVPLEFRGSEKGQSYWSLTITASPSGFEKLSTVPSIDIIISLKKFVLIHLLRQ